MVRFLAFFGIFTLFPTAFTQAQRPTLQQPIVQQLGARTAVSVPDRGATQMTGLRQGGTFSQQTGPLPSGRTSGEKDSAGAIQARAWVHEFAAKDAELLRQGENSVLRDRKSSICPHGMQSEQAGGTSEPLRPLPATEYDRALEILRRRR